MARDERIFGRQDIREHGRMLGEDFPLTGRKDQKLDTWAPR
jgi:hypothetical protein